MICNCSYGRILFLRAIYNFLSKIILTFLKDRNHLGFVRNNTKR